MLSLILILYLVFPHPLATKLFQYATLRDWEGSWPPRIEAPRWSLSSDTIKSSMIFLTSSYKTVFISSIVGRPRIRSYPQTGYWAIGPALSHMSSTYGIDWPPQLIYQDFYLFIKFQLMTSVYNDYSFYRQTKTSIDFLCTQGLNFRSLIQLYETLLVELTGTHHITRFLTNQCKTYLIFWVDFGLTLIPIIHHFLLFYLEMAKKKS